MTSESISPRAGSSNGAPEKWALLVGINLYRHSNGLDFQNLQGCLNDVADMRALLIGKFGFAASHIAVLTGPQATRNGILKAIRERLVDRAQPGDIAMLYYSGHGSECFDAARLNERDQTIVPYDARDAEGLVDDISGSDLNREFQDLRTRHGVFVLDSCHSGNMRARFTGRARSIPPRQRASVASGKPGANYVLLAASAPNELSVEAPVEGRTRGIFTYVLCRELRRATSVLTYRDLMDGIPPLVAACGSGQRPSLEGDAVDDYVFGVSTAQVSSYVLVWPSPDGDVGFEGGAELGFTRNSVYAIYPPGSKQLAPSAVPSAIVRLERVESLSAVGRIEQGGPVAPASRAVETSHSYEAAPIQVLLPADTAAPRMAELRARLAALDMVRIAGGEAEADLTVTADEYGLNVVRSGLPARTPAVPHGPAAAGSILDRVAHWARWLRVLALNNPAPSLAVDFQVSVAAADPGPGQALDCLVKNKSDVDLYLAMLNLVENGSIRLVYPIGEPSLLYAGRTLRKRFPLEAPREGEAPCREMVKLFATTALRDYSIFEAQSLRPALRPADSFDQLLLAAAFGPGRGGNPNVPCDWIALEQGFSYGS
jgi:hypothetical protein